MQACARLSPQPEGGRAVSPRLTPERFGTVPRLYVEAKNDRSVVPAALSGIMASFILALSRALGETMAVTLAAGANPQLTLNPGKSIETMTAYIVNTSKGDISTSGLVFPSLFAVGLTLFVFTLGMNLLAQRLVLKFRQVYA